MQADLFGSPGPAIAGLDHRDDIISPAQERALIAHIEALDLPHFPFQQWVGRRRTRSFGWRYDFKESGFGPTEPIPAFLLDLRERAARFARLSPETLVQASINKYEPGAGIGWHKDRFELQSVLGISLGSAAIMRFRRRTEAGFDRAALELAPRSIYHLDGEVRTDWEHSIAPGTELRWSITFRGLSEKGKRLASAYFAGGAAGGAAGGIAAV